MYTVVKRSGDGRHVRGRRGLCCPPALLRPRKDGNPHLAFTPWENQEAWKACMKTAEARLHRNPKFSDFDKMYATPPFEGFYDDVVALHGGSPSRS